MGSHLGFYFAIKLGRKISFAPEVQYIQKGYNFRNAENTLIRLQLESFELLFMLSYKCSKRLSIDAGPVAGLLLDGKVIDLG